MFRACILSIVLLMVSPAAHAASGQSAMPEAAQDKVQSKIQAKFFPLPQRGKYPSSSRLKSFHQKPAASRQPLAYGSRKQVEKQAMPPAGDADKLLLYVYSEMR